MRWLRVRFYGQYLDGSGRVTLRDHQRLSDFLNLPEHFLPLDHAVIQTTGTADRPVRESILLSKSLICLLVPIGQAQGEEMGLTNESMRVHKVTSRVAIYLPSLKVRGAVHHVAGANVAQHLDLRGDTFIPLTDVYVTSSRNGKPASFRARFALLNKDQAVAVRLKAHGKILSLRASTPVGIEGQPAAASRPGRHVSR